MASIGNDGNGETGAGKPTLGFTLPFADKAPANPAELMTAMTAASMAVGAQVASAFFGMMQAAFETSAQRHVSPDPSKNIGDEPIVSASREAPVDEPSDARKPVKQAKRRQRPVSVKNAVVAESKEISTPRRKANAKSDRSAPRSPADLKKISGVGPKLEGLLNSMGVLRLEQIAEWSDKDVEHFDSELGLDGRIAKDGWIAQAKALLR